MKVTFINRMMGIARGGGEYFDLNMARALAKIGVEIRFVTGRRVRRLDFPLDDFQTTYIKTPYLRTIDYRFNKTKSRLFAAGLRRLRWLDGRLFSLSAKRLLLRDSSSDIYQICALAWLGAELTSAGRMAVIRWPGPPSERVASLARNCAGVFSHGTSYEEARKWDPRVEYIVAGCDTELFRPREKKPAEPGQCRFLFVGRCIPVKNLEFLIKGFGEAKKYRPDIGLEIVGDGALLRKLKEQATALNLKEAITFSGALSGSALAERYQAADCFTLVSTYESFSLVAQEAMSSGLVLILSKVGNLPFFVEKFKAGSLIESGSVEQLRDAMIWWADNPAERIKTGKRNREAVEGNFTWEASAKKLRAFYERLLKENGRAQGRNRA